MTIKIKALRVLILEFYDVTCKPGIIDELGDRIPWLNMFINLPRISSSVKTNLRLTFT